MGNISTPGNSGGKKRSKVTMANPKGSATVNAVTQSIVVQQESVFQNQAWWGLIGLAGGSAISVLLLFHAKMVLWFGALPLFIGCGVWAISKSLHGWRNTVPASLVLSICLMLGSYGIHQTLPLEKRQIFNLGRDIVLSVVSENNLPLRSAFWLDRGSIIATCATPDRPIGSRVSLFMSQPNAIGTFGKLRGWFRSSGGGEATVVKSRSGISILRVVRTGKGPSPLEFKGPVRIGGVDLLANSVAHLEINRPSEGDTVFLIGADAGSNNYHLREGQVLQVEVEGELKDATAMMQIDIPWSFGYCGAPVTNEYGKVIAMVVGQSTAGYVKAILSIELEALLHRVTKK